MAVGGLNFLFLLFQETFLAERIKVNGKTKNFGNVLTIEKQKNKIYVNVEVPMSKRYRFSRL